MADGPPPANETNVPVAAEGVLLASVGCCKRNGRSRPGSRRRVGVGGRPGCKSSAPRCSKEIENTGNLGFPTWPSIGERTAAINDWSRACLNSFGFQSMSRFASRHTRLVSCVGSASGQITRSALRRRTVHGRATTSHIYKECSLSQNSVGCVASWSGRLGRYLIRPGCGSSCLWPRPFSKPR